MMVHACNPSYSGNGSRRILVWQKHEPLSEKQLKQKGGVGWGGAEVAE
jgi:hypothetical protein